MPNAILPSPKWVKNQKGIYLCNIAYLLILGSIAQSRIFQFIKKTIRIAMDNIQILVKQERKSISIGKHTVKTPLK